MLEIEMYIHEINNNPAAKLQHWNMILDGLIKQQKEYAVKPSTQSNQDFYNKVCNEIEKTKAWIKELKGEK